MGPHTHMRACVCTCVRARERAPSQRQTDCPRMQGQKLQVTAQGHEFYAGIFAAIVGRGHNECRATFASCFDSPKHFNISLETTIATRSLC